MKTYKVYIHLFPNNKRYIGVTTNPTYIRWVRGYGYKKQPHLYNAIKKYGWDNIEHIVYEVDTESEMFYLERYLISFYQTTNPKYGYNKSIGGDRGGLGNHITEWHKDRIRESNRTRTVSAETKLKISLSKKGHRIGPFTQEHRDKLRESHIGKNKKYPHILQYDLNGNLIKKWDNVKDIEKELGFKHFCIYSVIKGKSKTAYGFLWRKS